MCMSSPSMPAQTAPVQPQEVKQVEQGAFGSTSTSRNSLVQNGGSATSTLLTGPSGVENSQLRLARTTLLGQ